MVVSDRDKTGVSARGNVARLKHELAVRGMNQQALADATGLTRDTISRLMQGRRVRFETLDRIAEVLYRTPLRPSAFLVEQPAEKTKGSTASASAEPSGGSTSAAPANTSRQFDESSAVRA